MQSILAILAGLMQIPQAFFGAHVSPPVAALHSIQHIRANAPKPVVMEVYTNSAPSFSVDYTIPVTTQEDANAYSVDFGDGEEGSFTLKCMTTAKGVKVCGAVARHVYKTAGAYDAFLVPRPMCTQDDTDPNCIVPPDDPSEQSANSVSHAG
jgi:hypothetical protein